MESFQLYHDMQARTNGEIYLGVVGPVRTGKSTFIKRFMDLLVIPHMEDENQKARTMDELPQSSSGKTIMTTEPKFIPKEAADLVLSDDVKVKVRLIDCVGYMTEGAKGHIEDGEERKVKTPWFDYEIPFTKAAGIGTRKVIHDHATIGIVVTTDGTIGEIPRESYRDPEEKTIRELKEIGKPFLVLVNSSRPYGKEAMETAEEIRNKFEVTVLPVNCEQLKEEDIHQMMEEILFEFPVSELEFYIPKWVEMLPREHKIKAELIEEIRRMMEERTEIRDFVGGIPKSELTYIESVRVEKIEMDTGCVKIEIRVYEKFYYEMLSEMTGTQIRNEYELLKSMKEMSGLRTEYTHVKDAMDSVKMKGYGVVSPIKEEIRMAEPEIIRQGNKYGVKIHSEAPSIHMIRANIETEIAPIVGNEQQAQDVIRYIKEAKESEEGVWKTNIFGKSIEELVMDGMKNKITMINDECQVKLQDTMQKIVNDSNGGIVCIII
ncbi:stage IV sporulation protein A [Sellimonas sp.]|uniref:stage IV sporulation protein A n=1 Tax=Sellimonas sp. TaxID=2021466 RepID=UPI000B39797F|nr:stage IV sporulation protein A [Sellimonas sp.]OUP64987.1 stage IV sporulation protein A [Drancourtella sp. An177]